MYVSELVAPGTVNTMPGATLAAFADHGTVPATTMSTTYTAARTLLDALEAIGIDYDEVTDTLEAEGLAKFAKSWDELGATGSQQLIWFQSMQNWQSEFLAVAALVLLSIVLRQHGSPQSKLVTAPHAQTGTD